MKIIKVKKSDYWSWDGNWVHNSITNLMDLHTYTTEEGDPLFICLRNLTLRLGAYADRIRWGYIDEDGNEFEVEWEYT